jgi:hypothetical protein
MIHNYNLNLNLNSPQHFLYQEMLNLDTLMEIFIKENGLMDVGKIIN